MHSLHSTYTAHHMHSLHSTCTTAYIAHAQPAQHIHSLHSTCTAYTAGTEHTHGTWHRARTLCTKSGANGLYVPSATIKHHFILPEVFQTHTQPHPSRTTASYPHTRPHTRHSHIPAVQQLHSHIYAHTPGTATSQPYNILIPTYTLTHQSQPHTSDTTATCPHTRP